MAPGAHAIFAAVSREQRPREFADWRWGAFMEAGEEIQARRVRLRSALSGPDHGRRGLLRSEGFPVGSHGPAFGRKAQRRFGVHQPGDETRTGSHWAD